MLKARFLQGESVPLQEHMVIPSSYKWLRAAVTACHHTGFPDGETEHA